MRSIPAKPFDELIVSLLAEMGKHPEVIEKTTAELRVAAKKEVSPIKTQVEKLTREIKSMTAQLDRLTKLAQDPEAGDFSNSLLKEAREAQERKNTLELDCEALNVQIRMKEIGLVGSEAVAAQLRNFAK